MRTRGPSIVAVVVIAFVPLFGAVPAHAHGRTLVVRPGHSIQAAVDRAAPGDEIVVQPGTYRQTVTISKHDITLRGDHAKLVGPVAPDPRCDTGGTDIAFPGRQFGICIFMASHVRVEGFDVEHYDGAGIFVMFSDHVDIFDNVLAHDDGAGVYVNFQANDVTVRWNQAKRSGVGIWVDFLPTNPSITDNSTSHNIHDGIRVFDAGTAGRVARNRSWANTNGMVFEAGFSSVADWSVHHNHVWENSRTGILANSTAHSTFRHNWVFRNGSKSTLHGPTGGIVLRSLAEDFSAVDNVVTGNNVRHNAVVDIDADSLDASNILTPNRCGTSRPAGLC
jgi:nitrous oxidase accessory protein NosD